MCRLSQPSTVEPPHCKFNPEPDDEFHGLIEIGPGLGGWLQKAPTWMGEHVPLEHGIIVVILIYIDVTIMSRSFLRLREAIDTTKTIFRQTHFSNKFSCIFMPQISYKYPDLCDCTRKWPMRMPMAPTSPLKLV